MRMEIVAAAWLHDTVEKTKTTLQGIVDEFGDGIGELVCWLTDSNQGEGNILARTTALYRPSDDSQLSR